jgi:3-dehydroquinate dehydratase/shikimate dehydrogenase
VRAAGERSSQGCRVCLSLTRPTLGQDLQDIERHRGLIDLVELRADFLSPPELPGLKRFPSQAGLPVILTLRRAADGGRFRGSEGERRELVGRALSGAGGGSYAFLELEQDLRAPELEEAARRAGARVIRCLHDFTGVPAGLPGLLRRLPRRAGELPKAAVMPTSTEELLRLAEAFRELEGMPKILVGMGEWGLFSRILAPRLGSYLTFCAAGGQEAGPGQPDPHQLSELYRIRGVGRKTLVCGVIGRPIAHSRSPEIHNRGYAALGLDAVYIPFLTDAVHPFFRLAELLGLRGFSVTMPFKEAVLPLLSDSDPSLRAIGACNTVVRAPGGGWFGTNTDVQGFLAPLRRHAPELLAHPFRATVIGAGGAARSVLYALIRAGAAPLVLNRTPERARTLGELFRCSWGGLDAAGLSAMAEHGDLIVNATPVGLAAGRGADPLPGYRFRGSEVVYDLVYEPPRTPFLARAERAGCRIIPGLEMLQAQGEEQFRLFTGKAYPIRA